jgi:membrane-bound lytic murein transglycosylase D
MRLRALAVLAVTYGTALVFAPAAAMDEPAAEVEIIDIRALTLIPPSAEPERLLPHPHMPQEPSGGSAHLELGDIPFAAGTQAATAYSSLWERIRAGYGMQALDSPLVNEWETWYASRPDYVARMVARAERYLYYIVEEVEKRGMPSEIALLPMIESAYNPNAYSTAHASGIWQFIPATGKKYGLKQNWWQDERRDVLAATRAALDYLEALYEMFGSWELALASYNWGEGAVGRAIQRNEARGIKADYLSLDMPAETRNYIPKLMAVKNIVTRPESFGLTLAEVRNRPYFAVVATDRHIDVKLAATLAEMPLEEFRALNPSHNRPGIRAEASQPILLPADKAEVFQTNLQAHESPLTSWQSYTIGKGDRIERIAQRFGIALAQLREINSIPARLRDLAGLTILVPANGDQSGGDVAQAGFAIPAVASVAGGATAAAKHVVKAGETLAAIARRYRLNVAELAAQNGIRNGKIRAGQSLVLSAPATKSGTGTERSTAKRTASTPTARDRSPAARKEAAKPAPRVAGEGKDSTRVAYAPDRDGAR